MGSPKVPVSLVAERAVRHLRRLGQPVPSLTMVEAVLSTTAPDESTATRVLEAAFAGDPRLRYEERGWTLCPESTGATEASPKESIDPDRVYIVLDGERQAPGAGFALTRASAIRLSLHDVVAACGGDVVQGPQGRRLRRAFRETLDGAVPVLHDPPGSIRAFESWLEEPLAPPISLRLLARNRLGLGSNHDFRALAGRLGIQWRDTEDPLEQADALDACLRSIRRPGESLHELRSALADGPTPIDWSRYAFNREFLRRIPSVPGTYRFHDREGNLLYVGKSKNLGKRIGSYFREAGGPRSKRIQKLLDSMYKIDYDASGSDLEALLREAELIREEDPSENVQRETKRTTGLASRLRSILILEPSEPPYVLRAYLIRQGRLMGRVAIGPRGGGLKRIGRILDDHFFSVPLGPTSPTGPDLDVELVVRWLAANRDRVVALDPTDLGTSEEVIERLRWYLLQGSPFGPDGTPIISR